jgi:hypothetical protein
MLAKARTLNPDIEFRLGNMLALPIALVERLLSDAELQVEDVVERGPYAPEVEYQSRRAYIFARKSETPMA